MRLLCMLVLAALAAPATAQADLSGLWAARFVTPFERPPFAKGQAVAEADAADYVAQLRAMAPVVVDPDITAFDLSNLFRIRGELRTSIVIEPADGRMPLKPAAFQAMGKPGGAYDNPEERPLQERCLGGFAAPPMRPLPSVIPFRILQTRDHVVLNLEDVAGLRIVNLSGEPPPSAMRSVEGWSKGRWEGTALVVETSHFRSDLPVRELYGRPVVIGPDTRIMERFTRVSADELLYEFTVTDPHYYTQPWRGEFVLNRLEAADYEYACHEANYSLPNVLLGGRAEAARRGER